MKKLASILLLICIMFTVASCAIVPIDTDTSSETNSDTNTNTSTNTNTNTNTGSSNPPAILDYDKNVYEPRYSLDKRKIYYTNLYSFKAPEITPYYNNYKAAISMTFDDGEDLNAARTAASIMSKFGFEGTLMLIAGSSSVQNNLSGWQELVSEGVMDVGGHGWSHRNPIGLTEEQIEQEIKDTMDYLKQAFPDENPLTFATPEAKITDEYLAYLKEYGIIANRLSSGATIKPSEDYGDDIFKLSSPRIDNGTSPSGAEAAVRNVVNEGKWFIELYHSVRENGYSVDIPPATFEAHCQWLYNNFNGDVWFGSYDDVAKYIAQYKATTIEYTACDSESMTFFAKSEVDYGVEMTVKLYMPFFIDSAYVIIDGEYRYTQIKREPNARSVMFNIPISTEGVEIKLVMGGNDKYSNNCPHEYVENEVVAPTEDAYGYTEMICTSCEHTYKSKYTNKTK